MIGDQRTYARTDVARPEATESMVAIPSAYRDHRQAVFQVANRVCGPSMAEEVTQEAFVQLWHHPERFDPERGTLRTYLTTIAYYKAVDVVRSEQNRRTRERRINYTAEFPTATLSEIELSLVEREESDRIADAVRQLPRREREAVVTAFFGHCSYREAARMLGQAEGTTKSRIRSGLRRLGVALADSSLDAATWASIR